MIEMASALLVGTHYGIVVALGIDAEIDGLVLSEASKTEALLELLHGEL